MAGTDSKKVPPEVGVIEKDLPNIEIKDEVDKMEIAEKIKEKDELVPVRETLLQIKEQIEEKKKKGKMIKDENDEDIDIKYDTYKNYFGKYYGGLPFLIITNISMVFYCFSSIGCDYIIGQWTNTPDQKTHMWVYAGFSLVFAVCTAGSVMMRVSTILYYSLGCDRKLHE
jgi:hypothetical protein